MLRLRGKDIGSVIYLDKLEYVNATVSPVLYRMGRMEQEY